jgi:4-hydroxy-tetrahydrodipicolinate reductase
MEITRVCVIGSAGRMGQRVIKAVEEASDLELAAEVDPLGDAIDLAVALSRSDAAIDFAAPPAVKAVAPVCVQRGVSYVVASTGLTSADQEALHDAARTIAIVQAANFSVGVNVLAELVGRATGRLGEAFDIEISEIHHRHKRDAPSGTARMLADVVRQARPELAEMLDRSGRMQQRGAGELGVAALRGGDVSGEHTVYFFGDGERIEITHRATTPNIFALGALRAARWLRGRPAGLYTMRDVLGAA